MENTTKRLICISFWFIPPCLSKIKELNQNIIGKGLFAAIKEHLCLTKKKALRQSRKVGGGWIPLTGTCFWHISFKLRKKFS